MQILWKILQIRYTTWQIVINGNGVNAIIISVSQDAKVVTTPDKPGSDDNQPPSS